MMTRFCRYIERVFDWSRHLQALTDSRKQPQIPTSCIFLSAMMMCVTRMRSLNALESQLRIPKQWDSIVGKRKPSADRIGEVVDLMDPEQLRDLLSAVDHKIGRNKLLKSNPWAVRFVALDGHEFFSQ